MRGWLVVAALLIITILCYAKTLHYGFFFDDYPTIVDNVRLHTSSLWQFLGSPRWVSRMLHHIVVQCWGVQPFPFRAVGLALHLISGLVLFWVLFLTLGRFYKRPFFHKHGLLIATCTAGLFLLHPVQSQTVLYITQATMEGLVVLFSFLLLLVMVAIACTTNFLKKIGLSVVTLLIAVFASGAKEISVVLPLLGMIFDWFLLSQGQWHSFKKRLLLHGGVVLIIIATAVQQRTIKPSLVATVTQLSHPIKSNRGNILTHVGTEQITSLRYCFSQAKVIVHYLTIFFWPLNLSFDYDFKLASSFWCKEVLIPLTILLFVLISFLVLWVQQPSHPFIFCFLWFFVALLPRASFFPSTEMVCDYRTYYPSLGILLFIAFLIAFCVVNVSNRFYRGLVPLTVSGLLVGCCFLTITRSNVWRSSLAFWQDVIRHAPCKARAHNNYAVALVEAGLYQKAKGSFAQAIALDKQYAEPHINLGSLYQKEGNITLAKMHYRRALEIGEGHPELFYNLAKLYLSQDRKDLALTALQQAIHLRANYSKAWDLLATIKLRT